MSIFTSLKLPNNIKNKNIILYIILIYIGSFLLILLINSIIYAIKLYFYTNHLEKKYNSLNIYNKDLINKYNNLLKQNNYVPIIIEKIRSQLRLATVNPKIEDINFIKDVIHILDLDELIYNERTSEDEGK